MISQNDFGIYLSAVRWDLLHLGMIDGLTNVSTLLVSGDNFVNTSSFATTDVI